ncbi:MAG TPA: hypothetical protein VMT03_25665 [Polyangia bacterium]|nr:hypothetical protein [Polyangia bacterium]
MPLAATLLCAALLAGASTPKDPATPDEPDDAERAREPAGGTGVSPVELIPRLELRQVYTRAPGGVSVHDTIVEMDIEFLKRIMLRYQLPARLMESPAGQVSGIGDIQIGLVAVLGSTPRFVAALLGGAVLNSATEPKLGEGRTQVMAGAGAAYKPYPWWLAYGVAQEQLSVGSANGRPDVNQLMADAGSILFGRQFNWLKIDLQTTVDFPGGATGRLYGMAEAGSLVIGRVGLFMRLGTQLAGPRLVDLNLAAGVRYLFRLETRKGAPPSSQSW